MSCRFRFALASKIFDALRLNVDDSVKAHNQISSALSLIKLNDNRPAFKLRVKDLKLALKTRNPIPVDEIAKIELDNEFFTTTESRGGNFTFSINENLLIKQTLSSPMSPKLFDIEPESVIVEFSSPNIAKPFHIGHLRSTIIGNAYANLLAASGHNVTRMNYLGDWGTQFGLLKIGMDLSNASPDEIKENPIKHLFHAYVAANRLAENDDTIADRARELFSQMESGSGSDLGDWMKYREYTVAELERIYRRLGVTFDVYAWESDYRKSQIGDVIERLKTMEGLRTDDEGKLVADIDEHTKVSVLKSDGSTLYLTRDIAAIVDRQNKFKFDRMIYVAGNEQQQHFRALFEIARRMGVKNADKLIHAKFGRVEGMSTRRGNVVFLSDLLDEAKQILYERQVSSENTKIDLSDSDTADILATSAIIISELQRKATSKFTFDLEKTIEDLKKSGAGLQFEHCRLHSLEQRNGIFDEIECNPELLREPLAQSLIIEIAQFPEAVHNAATQLSPQILVKYLLSLDARIGSAARKLFVLNQPNDLQRQRTLMYRRARETMAQGMKLLGLKSLEKM